MHLEKRLQCIHNRDYAYLVGSGTAGIYGILKVMGFKNARVGIPNSVCMNVPLAVIFSGNQPVYLDISIENLGLSMESLENCPVRLDVVIAVHSYGSVCNIEAISKYCKRQNIFLVEDLAVAQGAKINGKPAGTFGDVSLVSFGKGKIVDVGHGGAVLTDNRDLLKELINLGKCLSPHTSMHDKRISRLNSYYTQLYNNYYGRGLKEHTDHFCERAIKSKDAFLFSFDLSYCEKIESGLKNIELNISTRKKYAEFLTNRLSDLNIEIFQPPEGSVHWRYNIFLKRKNRDIILHTLLRKGYKISSWFPSVDLYFGKTNEIPVNTPISDHIGETILNIWINHEVNEDYLISISEEILQLLSDSMEDAHVCNAS